MKIAFIALALVLSTWAQAEEPLRAEDNPLSATSREPAKWNEMSTEERNAWMDKKHKIIQEEAQRKYLADKQQEAREDAEREANKPKCTNIRFTGIATPPPYAQVIAQTLASRDIEDTLARNPIQCRPNQFGNSVCTGVAYFRSHKGRVVDWNKDFFIINTPIDFNTGRENIELTIRRKDATCIK